MTTIRGHHHSLTGISIGSGFGAKSRGRSIRGTWRALGEKAHLRWLAVRETRRQKSALRHDVFADFHRAGPGGVMNGGRPVGRIDGYRHTNR